MEDKNCGSIQDQMKRGKSPSSVSPIIDTDCTTYRMILAPTIEKKIRSKKKATRGRSSVPKSEPLPADINRVSQPRKTPKVEQLTRKGSFTRKKSDVLATSNKIPVPSSSLKDVGDAKRAKRKRYADEIAAENIPVETMFAPLKFGVNKDISPKKRRRLQSLICPSPNHN